MRRKGGGVMKALTILQPYASLIASGRKWVENRNWYTNYRGPLAIHAGKGLRYLDRESITAYPTGCIIATAMLSECIRIELLRALAKDSKHRNHPIGRGCNYTWDQACIHAHTEGPYCWILSDVQEIKHVVMRGKQGLWVPHRFGVEVTQ
jgi:hypothetical protein